MFNYPSYNIKAVCKLCYAMVLAAIFLCSDAVAQQRTISGVVSSEKENLPLPGVSIKVKNSTNGVVTDGNGRFTIAVPNNSTLVFSYIGFVTKEYPAVSVPMNVRLSEDMTSLAEVIVQVPYGSQTKASFTGSSVTVKATDLEGRPRASFQESLQGNVAGLQSTTGTGQPGAGLNVRIRGVGSYSAASSPLYVVDGVPVVDGAPTVLAFSSNTLAGISANDIESVTVLKDASATSIYGSRAANGVVLITTKRGAAGRTKVSATGQQGFSQVALTDKNKPLSTAETTELLIEGVINNTTGALASINTPEAAYQYLITQGLKPDVNTDWYDVITQKGNFGQYDVSASGGGDKTTFYVSGGYYKQDAVTKGQGFERITTRLRVKNQASDRLSINMGLAPNFQKLSTIGNAGLGANPVRSLNRLVPWVTPYNADGSYSGILYNPEVVRKENRYDTRLYSIIGDLGAELKILKDLSAESKVAIDMNYTDDYRYWSPLWVDGASVKGRGANYTTTIVNWNITNLLKYRKQFNDLGLEATLGQEAQKITNKRVSTQADNFAAEGLYSLSSAATPYVTWSDYAEAALVSYFLNTSLNYKQKYYLNLTGRTDGSSRFGANVRYGTFGSIGFAWNMHKEDFMSGLSFLNELKLRASYGVNGNQASEYYGVPGIYSTGGVYAGEPAYIMAQIQNDNLTWEKNKPFDIGIDFALFGQRLTGAFDYYSRVTSALLMNAPISFTNGLGTINQNIGSIKNSGIELTLNSHNIKSSTTNGFNWRTGFNISTSKNTVEKLSGVSQIISGRYNREIGGNYYEFYIPGWAGVDPTSGDALWYTDGTKTATTKTYTQATPFNQGSALPKFFGGLTNTFDYQRFSLSFMVYFNWGGKLLDEWGTYTSNDGSSGVTDYGAIARVDYDNRWKQPGDNAKSPKMVYRGTQTGLASQMSSRFLYDASYIRLRDVTLSYDIPVSNKILNKAQVYFRANNLFTYTKDDMLRNDPETYVGGILNQNIPVSRQLLFGLNINF